MDDDRERHRTPSFRIWLCGAFRVERRVGTAYEVIRTAEWGGSSYPRLLLKALLCCPGRQARREALLDMLWPEMDPEQAAQNLNTATTKLRKVLQPVKGQESLLITEDDCKLYLLEGQHLLWVDVDAAFARFKEAERCGRTSSEALPLLEEADTYFSKGAFLQDEEGHWAAGRRATVEQARYRCRFCLSEAYEQQGMPGQAGTVLSLLLEEDPTDEDVLCLLLGLLHRQGMIHQALKLYEHTREVFAREGMDLSEATKHIVAQLSLHNERTSNLQLLPLQTNGQSNGFSLLTPSLLRDRIEPIGHFLQGEFVKRPGSVTPIDQTSNRQLLQDIIDRNFLKGVTYGLLSSNIRTMNFRDEWQYIVNNLVAEAKIGLRAMVFDVELTRWWNTIAGQMYMITNMELLKRKVPVKRIFILSSLDTRLRANTLMTAYVHHKIGIDVRVCEVTGFQESIPFKPDMFSVHDNLFVALYYFSFEKPLTNLLLEDTHISEFRSFYDELFRDDRLCTDIESILARSNCGESFFASVQTQLELLHRLKKIGSVTDLARKLW